MSRITAEEDSELNVKVSLDKRQGVQKFITMEKQKPQDILLLFKNKSGNTRKKAGDADVEEMYYSVYGKDAIFLANYYTGTLAALKFIDCPYSMPIVQNLTADSYITRRDIEECQGKGLPVIYIKERDMSPVLQKCINQKKMRVEVWARVAGGEWTCERTGSPGNLSAFQEYFREDAHLQATSLALHLSVVAKHISVGVAFCESTSNALYFCQFFDNEQFSVLETVLNQTGASEVLSLFDKNNNHHRKVKDILDKANVIMTEQTKKAFDFGSIEQDLDILLKKGTNIESLLDEKLCCASMSCLVKAMDLLADSTNQKSFTLEQFKLHEYMKLDSTAFNALNILPQPTDLNPQMNLYGLLNQCQTIMGKRRLIEWIRMPLMDKEQIDNRHDFVDAFLSDIVCLNNVRRFLKKVPDLSGVINRINRGRGTIQDMVKLYQFVQSLPELAQVLSEHSDQAEIIRETFTQEIEESANKFVILCNLVETAVDLEAIENHEYLINPDFNEELKELKEKKDEIKESIEALREQAEDELGCDVKLDKTPQSGYFFKVASKDEKKVSSKKKKYTVIDHKSKSGTKFTSEELREQDAAYSEIYEQYQNKQSELTAKCMEAVMSYLPPLSEVVDVIGQLDVLSNFAHVSSAYNYQRPLMLESGQADDRVVLRGSRHPCLERQDFGDQVFIPNDVDMRKGQSSFTVITGPNMGGKSTYIRQIGMIVLMAQIGCFVPCDSAEISVRDCILARVGASDSQLRGISTFMAEMLETSTILHNATENSLIIIDELGRGTSSYDGFGLAWAISEHIIKEKKSMCLFATHFHELTTLSTLCDPEDERSVAKFGAFLSVANKSVAVKADQNHIVMCYKIQDGPSNKSFGIEVAKLANFPDEVITVAKRKAEELESIDGTEDDSDQPATKKRKISPTTVESIQFMQHILKQFCQIPIDDLSDDELAERLKQLREQVDQTENPVLKTLIQKHQQHTNQE